MFSKTETIVDPLIDALCKVADISANRSFGLYEVGEFDKNLPRQNILYNNLTTRIKLPRRIGNSQFAITMFRNTTRSVLIYPDQVSMVHSIDSWDLSPSERGKTAHCNGLDKLLGITCKTIIVDMASYLSYHQYSKLYSFAEKQRDLESILLVG